MSVARQQAASRPAAVLLAAGFASRMRGIVKLLLEIDGEPLVRRTLRVLHEAGVSDVVVVLGHHATQIAPVLEGCSARVLHHAGYQAGQQSSVLAGLRALAPDADPVLVVLGDLPLLEPQDISGLLAAFAARPAGRRVLVPRAQGLRGNPVVVERSVVDEVLLADDETAGLRGFIDRNRQVVASFEAPNDHTVVDLDTPQDIVALEQRLGRRVEGWDRGKLNDQVDSDACRGES